MQTFQGLQKFSYKSIALVKRNAPTILTYASVAGVVGTAVVTAKGATKAAKILEVAEEVKGEELTRVEKIKLVYPVYIPALLLGATTAMTMISANILGKRSQAALISAYGMLDRSYKEYQNTVKELYGEDADTMVKDKQAQDRSEDIRPLDDGKVLFYDEYSRRYFRATMEDVERAKYNLNRNMVMRDYVYLSEWYDELGLPPIDGGYKLGWSTGQCFDMYWQSWIDFGHRKITLENGVECNVITMFMEPVIDFEDYF